MLAAASGWWFGSIISSLDGRRSKEAGDGLKLRHSDIGDHSGVRARARNARQNETGR
jgi:hypothetical protein